MADINLGMQPLEIDTTGSAGAKYKHLKKIEDDTNNSSLIQNYTFEPSEFYNNGEFDSELFNKKFLNEQRKKSILTKIKDEESLKIIAEQEKQQKKFHQLSIIQHSINMKDALFGLIIDTITFNFKGILSKDHRLFYFGFLLLIIVIIFALLNLININDH
jgi:hypothetical protein